MLKEYLNKSLFWDTDFSKLDVDKYPKSVIERVIERGDNFQKEKLIEYYGFEKVRNTMMQARYIHPLGINFVLSKLDIPLTELRFYKFSKETGGNFLYNNDDSEIDQYLCF